MDSGLAALIGVFLGGVITILSNWLNHLHQARRTSLNERIVRIERLHRQINAQIDYFADLGMRLVFAYGRGAKVEALKENAIPEIEFLVNVYLPSQTERVCQLWDLQNKIAGLAQEAMIFPSGTSNSDKISDVVELVASAKEQLQALKKQAVQELRSLLEK